MMMALSILEIKDLAEFAGLEVKPPSSRDDMEAEITITECPKEGIEDEGTQRHFKHIAYFSEYPEEGAWPLGSECGTEGKL